MKYLYLGLGSLVLVSIVTGVTVLLHPYLQGGTKYSIEGLWLIVFLLLVIIPAGIYNFQADTSEFAVSELRKRKRKEKPTDWNAEKAKTASSKRVKRREIAVDGDIRINTRRGRQMHF